MTLVLTELSKFGVAMAADSAVTFPGGRVYIGAQKLLPVYKLNAGIAVWGQGEIGNEDADIWLQKFIDNKTENNMSLWNFAELLADGLNKAFSGVIKERMGVHVAGFDKKQGIFGPVFYHIHNGHYHLEYSNGSIKQISDEPHGNPPIREFRAHEDCAPKLYSDNDSHLTRNGDFSVFAILKDKIEPIIKEVSLLTGLKFPYPLDLARRGEYLRFWVDTIVSVYRLSNKRIRILPQPATAGDASIGGPVTVLTISESGIESFYTK